MYASLTSHCMPSVGSAVAVGTSGCLARQEHRTASSVVHQGAHATVAYLETLPFSVTGIFGCDSKAARLWILAGAHPYSSDGHVKHE